MVMAARVRAVSFASAVTNVLLVFASVVTNCAAAQGRRRPRLWPSGASRTEIARVAVRPARVTVTSK